MSSNELFLHVVHDGHVAGMGLVFSTHGDLLCALPADAVERIRGFVDDAPSPPSVRYRVVDPRTCRDFSEPSVKAAIDRFNCYFARLFRRGSPLSDSYPLFGKVIKEVLSGFIDRATTIVDFGCGHGSYEPLLRTFATNVLSLDIDAPPGPDAQVPDMRPLCPKGTNGSASFELGTADAVLCAFVLEHVASPRETLSRIRGLLRKDGKLILAIPSLDLIETLRVFLLRRKMTLPIHHLRTFGIASSGYCESVFRLRRHLRRSGFRVVHVAGVNVFKPSHSILARLNSFVGSVFPFRYLGAQTVVVAQRT